MTQFRSTDRLSAREILPPPSEQDGGADFRVIEVGTTPRGTIVAIQAHAGEPRTGLRLLTVETRELWEVRGVAFAPPEAIEAGRWGLLLVPVGHQGTLHVDDRLQAA